MPEYTGVSRVLELENVLTELLDLWDAGTICLDEDADADECHHVDGIIARAMQIIDGDELDVEVELEPD